MKVGLALSQWRALTPIEKAVEFFSFDFEFADDPSDTGLKDNIKVERLGVKNVYTVESGIICTMYIVRSLFVVIPVICC